MHGNKSNSGKTPAKITPLETRRKTSAYRVESSDRHDEDSLGKLLLHMRRIRETIPVNEQLREELRARLTAMQVEDSLDKSPPAATEAGESGKSFPFLMTGRGRQLKFLWLLPAALLLVAAFWMWWMTAAPKSLEAGPTREISRFWPEENPLGFACGTQKQGFLAIRNNSLQLLDQYGNQTGTVTPPSGQSYASPALTRAGDRLALVRRCSGEGAEIITVPVPPVSFEAEAVPRLEEALAGAEVLLKVEQGKSLTDLTWSPGRHVLAYTLGEPGGENEIYLLAEGKEPVSLGPGRHPTWSPDGSRLVVERTGTAGRPELWLVETDSDNVVPLTEGRRPAWGPNGYLAYIRTAITERVLTYGPDGSPLFTVRQHQEEIRTVFLGRKGSVPNILPSNSLPGDRLLLAPESMPGAEELNWLRKLELDGIREPRTLLLDQLSSFENISFSPEGKTLLAARQDDGTVALVQVSLREKLTRGGER